MGQWNTACGLVEPRGGAEVVYRNKDQEQLLGDGRLRVQLYQAVHVVSGCPADPTLEAERALWHQQAGVDEELVLQTNNVAAVVGVIEPSAGAEDPPHTISYGLALPI